MLFHTCFTKKTVCRSEREGSFYAGNSRLMLCSLHTAGYVTHQSALGTSVKKN